MVGRLSLEDLPQAPWALHTAPAVQIGRTYVRAAPYARVTDNEAWLEGIKTDLEQGPGGARSRSGALERDLRALARILIEGG